MAISGLILVLILFMLELKKKADRANREAAENKAEADRNKREAAENKAEADRNKREKLQLKE